MRAWSLVALLLLALGASAAKLSVRFSSTPAHEIVEEQCPCAHVSDRSSMRKSHPGTITAMVSGGVAPYTIIWRGSPWTSGLSRISAEPGIHWVTVVDAAGAKVKRAISVRLTRSRSWAQCPCKPELEKESPQKRKRPTYLQGRELLIHPRSMDDAPDPDPPIRPGPGPSRDVGSVPSSPPVSPSPRRPSGNDGVLRPVLRK